MNSVLLPGYIHVVDNRLKHASIRLNEEGDVVIKSPRVDEAYIEKLLIKHAGWIEKARKKFDQKKGKQSDILRQKVLYFKGELYPLQLKETTRSQETGLRFHGEFFELRYCEYSDEKLYEMIDIFYKNEAIKTIPPLVEKWSVRMSLYPQKISFRKTMRQWGSCSSKNRLSLNTMMMKLPLDVIEYIIIHELSHIAHKHHQKAFWELVEHHCPEYKASVQELKSYIP
ncbi:MAG TPA: M48 family peptidase [Epsilonproteobacteria bacterium]|nr:M48 family peptidase [Campylobacterota bacterium]